MRHRTPFRHALPVSEELFRQPLYLTHAGWERIAPNVAYWKRTDATDAPIFAPDDQGGRTLPEFCLAFVMAGGGELQAGSQSVQWRRLKAGDAFLFSAGEWHRYRPSSNTGWTVMWIHFNGDAPLQWMRDGCFNLRENIPVIENQALFRAQFEYLIECVHRDAPRNSTNFSYQVIGLLSHFLSEQSTGPTNEGADSEPSAVKTAIEYIWSFGHGTLDVPSVARAAGVPRRTLERQFKAATGRSILDEIQFCRVSRAARLLKETTLPVKNIVDRAGFSSSEHMRLALQKAFGKSAQAIRTSAVSIVTSDR
jgi:AraC-like DNA-binding protein